MLYSLHNVYFIYVVVKVRFKIYVSITIEMHKTFKEPFLQTETSCMRTSWHFSCVISFHKLKKSEDNLLFGDPLNHGKTSEYYKKMNEVILLGRVQ